MFCTWKPALFNSVFELPVFLCSMQQIRGTTFEASIIFLPPSVSLGFHFLLLGRWYSRCVRPLPLFITKYYLEKLSNNFTHTFFFCSRLLNGGNTICLRRPLKKMSCDVHWDLFKHFIQVTSVINNLWILFFPHRSYFGDYISIQLRKYFSQYFLYFVLTALILNFFKLKRY